MLAALRSFGPADALDVAIGAALFYAALCWLRRSHALLAAGGLALLGGVYLGARLLGLHLTTWIFQGSFAALALAGVVIFQDELRRGSERWSRWPAAIDSNATCTAGTRSAASSRPRCSRACSIPIPPATTALCWSRTGG